MSYQDKAEITREFYRKQGEQRQLENTIKKLERLLAHHPGTKWDLYTLIRLIK